MSSFQVNGRAAIVQSPDYFLWWYTAKSVGLGLAIGVIGYMIGRSSRR